MIRSSDVATPRHLPTPAGNTDIHQSALVQALAIAGAVGVSCRQTDAAALVMFTLGGHVVCLPVTLPERCRPDGKLAFRPGSFSYRKELSRRWAAKARLVQSRLTGIKNGAETIQQAFAAYLLPATEPANANTQRGQGAGTLGPDQ